MARNLARIIAIELLVAAQAIDFRRPLRTSDALEEAHRRVRETSPRLGTDRPLGGDIEALAVRLLGGLLDPVPTA
jgi:histidine ammonia-lyase